MPTPKVEENCRRGSPRKTWDEILKANLETQPYKGDDRRMKYEGHCSTQGPTHQPTTAKLRLPRCHIKSIGEGVSATRKDSVEWLVFRKGIQL